MTRGLSSVADQGAPGSPRESMHRVGSINEFTEGHVRGFRINGTDVAVVKRGDRFIAFYNCCTHSAFACESS